VADNATIDSVGIEDKVGLADALSVFYEYSLESRLIILNSLDVGA
jgi:hypothetical protein